MIEVKLFVAIILTFCVCVHDCSFFRKQTNRQKQILDQLKHQINPKNRHQIAPSTLAREGCDNQIKHDELCLSEDCIHLSSRILAKIDRSTDPCHDFYKFSCGKWQEANAHKIGDENLYYASNLNEMPEEVDTILKGLISKKIKIYDEFYNSHPYKDLKHFHKSCLNEERIKKESFAPAARLLKSLRKFFVGRPFDKNSFDVTEAVVELLEHNGSPLFEVSIDSKLHNSSQWGLVVSTPRHYGLIQTKLIGSKSRKGRKTGLKKVFRTKTRKILAKLLEDMQNDLFLLELLNKVKKGKRIDFFSENSELKKKFSNWETKTKNQLSFYSKLIENESKNKMKEEYNVDKDTKQNTNDVTPNNNNMNNDLISFNNYEENSHIDFQNQEENIKNVESILKKDALSPGVVYVRGGNDSVTDVKFLVSILDSQTMSSMNDSFYAQLMEDETVLNNISSIMIPILLNNIPDLDEEKLMSILNLLNGTSSDEDFIVLSEDEESQLQAMEMIQSLGILPTLSRKQLYEEIQNEMKNIKSKKFSDTLRIPEFKQLLDLPRIVESKNLTSNFNESYFELEEKVMEEILNFVLELNELEPSERVNVLMVQKGEVYNTFTLAEIQEKYSLINWRHLLSAVTNISLSDDEVIQVYYTDYMTKAMEFIGKKEPWLVHHGMLLLYVVDVLNELVSLDQDEKREDFCFSVTKETMTDVLSHMYLHHNGPHKLQELKDEILPMTQATTQTAIDLILKNPWMTSSDKVVAINKLKKMDWQIGGLDKHLKLEYIEKLHEGIEMKDQHFLVNVMVLYTKFRNELYSYVGQEVDANQLIWSFTAQPYTINAFHLQSTNSIVMPEAFFRPPYYTPGAPSYFNYGSAGMAFAHEMVHALDLTGSLFDAHGTISRPFSPNLNKNLIEKIGCYNDMVQSTFTEVAKIEGLDVVMEIDNNATMNENIADISGLHFSFNTYLKQLPIIDPEPKLPGVGFTNEQLFFIGFTQPYCAIIPTLAKVILMEIDEHLTHDIRVNGLMMNSPDFANVFKCKAGDRMYNEVTCPIF